MLEPRWSDGSTPGADCLEDILQITLEPKLIGPAPEVSQVELEVGVLDDADHIVKISWSSGSQFHENEVFG